MSLVSALVTGSLLGIHHALEADHLAAVTALVDHEVDRPSLVGTSWGLGHSIPVVALGLFFLLLGVRVPAAFRSALEVGIGVLLVVLGGRLLVRAAGVRVERHAHGVAGSAGDDSRNHSHEHSPSQLSDHTGERSHAESEHHTHDHGASHTHLRIGDDLFGLSHQHVDNEGFLVGVLHGVAGSGLIVVALVSTSETVDSALVFLAGFTALSVLTMGVLSAVWGRVVGGRRARLLEIVAGSAGVALGVLLIAEQAGLSPF